MLKGKSNRYRISQKPAGFYKHVMVSNTHSKRIRRRIIATTDFRLSNRTALISKLDSIMPIADLTIGLRLVYRREATTIFSHVYTLPEPDLTKDLSCVL